MFGSLGFPELLFILVLALLIFGPKRLPEIGRTIGKGLAEFRRASNDLKRSIDTEILAADAAERRSDQPPPPRAKATPELASSAGDGSPVAAAAEAVAPPEQTAGTAAEPPAGT